MQTRKLGIELTPDDLRNIEQAASQINIQGDRYPKALRELARR